MLRCILCFDTFNHDLFIHLLSQYLGFSPTGNKFTAALTCGRQAMLLSTLSDKNVVCKKLTTAMGQSQQGSSIWTRVFCIQILCLQFLPCPFVVDFLMNLAEIYLCTIPDFQSWNAEFLHYPFVVDFANEFSGKIALQNFCIQIL